MENAHLCTHLGTRTHIITSVQTNETCKHKHLARKQPVRMCKPLHAVYTAYIARQATGQDQLTLNVHGESRLIGAVYVATRGVFSYCSVLTGNRGSCVCTDARSSIRMHVQDHVLIMVNDTNKETKTEWDSIHHPGIRLT